jgi:hypothetical protein
MAEGGRKRERRLGFGERGQLILYQDSTLTIKKNPSCNNSINLFIRTDP